MPAGFDAVVMREHVRLGAGGCAELRAPPRSYQHIRLIGEDLSAGELLLHPGHRLRAVDLAAVAAAGVTDVCVRRRPRVVIIPTGDEVVPTGTDALPGQIVDTNSLMLSAQAAEVGCVASVTAIVPDDPDRIAAALAEATERADLVIVIAGSSAGRDDYTAQVVADAGTLVVHGVAVRPGHPVVLGVTVGGTPVMGAPGYPVAAALAFELFAIPLLARLQGTAGPALHHVEAWLARDLPSAPSSEEWVRVRLSDAGGRLVAAPLARGAGVLTSLVRADGMVKVPAGACHVLADQPVQVQLLRDGRCHVAAAHLLDEASGDYTWPGIDRLFADGPDVSVVRLGHLEIGLIVAAGNPHGVEGLQDVARLRLRYVNRQAGSATRMLLDRELSRIGTAPDAVEGYQREAQTHLAVAAAIAAGQGDVGLGTRVAASFYGLDFHPVAEEPYDLVTRAELAEDPLITPLWELLADPAFRARIGSLAGFSCAETGRRIR